MAPKIDQEIVLKLIEDNRRIIFKICNAYCKNEHDREDLQQEIVYQLWKSYPTYKQQYKFTTWMYRVALNIAISFYRKTKITEHIIALDDEPLEIADKPDNTSETEKNISTLHQFINDLKELDKALMILYLEEKSYNEIAEILGISETNVAPK
ncbi:MAG: sigma-70 family RNA polymerase sigma factor [Ferruginibacter sp.]